MKFRLVTAFSGAISLFVVLFVVCGNSTVNAEVFRPYVVDEKPQVIFSESVPVGDYYGLENYIADYVGGYLHMSYTITHAYLGFTNYPPVLYVYPDDPRTRVITHSELLFTQTASPIQDYPLPTDYYLVDMQFSPTGYRQIVTQGASSTVVFDNTYLISNINNETFVALANGYPMNPPNQNSMAFTPVRLIESQVGNSNVLFIPGLLSSRLYRDEGVLNCNFNCEDQIWEPDLLERVHDLYLDVNGDSVISNIYTRDIIDTASMMVFFKSDFYKNLILKLDALKQANEINDWKAWAYDWRKDVNDLVENGTEYENDQIITLIGVLSSLVNTSQNGKVTIVAHSNGGLVVKALIKKLQDIKTVDQSNLIDKINNLVLIASPQLGTPDAFSSILHGYDRAIPFVINDIEARNLSRNMPSSYGLLPSEKYFEQPSVGSIAQFSSTSPVLFRNFYGTEINNYSEQNSFILGGEGRIEPAENNLISPILGNDLLLNKGNVLHDVIDNMIIPEHINVITVAGWGKETIAGMKYTATDIEPIYIIEGDKTVVSASAQYGQGTKYWIDLSNSKLEHKNITEHPDLLTFIENLVKEESISLSIAKPLQTEDRLQLGVHSPVSVGVYDNLGNFTGVVCQSNVCDVVEGIPGSSYDEFGEGKYVNLGKGDLQKIVLQGAGVGTFTFDSKVVSPNGSEIVSKFIDIPVTTQTTAEVTLVGNTPEMKLDVTGDGMSDFNLLPTNEFNPVTFLQIMKKTVDSLDVAQAKKTTLNKRIDNIIKQIEKGKIDKAKLKAEKFKSALEKKINKPDPKHPKPKKLSKTDAQILLDMLNKLLDNLE